MDRKINFWNSTDGKTKHVVEYIENLKEPENAPDFDDNKFIKMKKEALKMKTSNEMLEYIGYNVKGLDKIFYICVVRKGVSNEISTRN
jgi:hypothetical protein